MDLQFDSKGYLTPYHIHSIDKETLQDIFVTNVGRKEIYLCYLQVIESLINIVGGGFYVWVNGSFISLKENPNDIDMVVFIDYSLCEKYEKELNDVRKMNVLIDLYRVKVYPQSHKYHFRTEFDKQEWEFLFSTDRKKNAKGFVQINY